jgi:restriction endonuclease S subunit
MIPDGWTEMPLKAVFKLGSGDSRPKDLRPVSQGEHTSPVYGGNGILGYSSAHNSIGDDIIIGRVGEYCGITRLVPGRKWITDNALFAKSVDANFCRAFLTLRLQHFDLSKLRSKSGQPLVSQEPIYAQRFAFPPKAEQEMIVSIVSTWDRAIDTVEALIANARAQKEALMQSLLTGKHRLPGFSGSTRFVSLSEVARIETGSSNREDSLDIGEFTFFDRSTDVRRSDRFLFDAEAIIIGGEGQEFIPKYFVGKFDLHQRAYALHSFNNAFGRYIFYAAHHSRHLLRRYAVGSTVASLRMPTFQKVKIWLPSVEEQIAIADHLTLADDGLEGLSTQLTVLRQEKSALMQQLLTGKRRVKLTDSDHS